MDEHTISPAGDPFYAEAQRDEPKCFVCRDGWVFLGRLNMTEEGEEVEVIEAVPCRRCQRS